MMQALLRRVPKRLHDVLLGRVALGLAVGLSGGLLIWSLASRYPQISRRQGAINDQIALDRNVQNLRVQLAGQMNSANTNVMAESSARLIASEDDLATWTQQIVVAGLERGLRVQVTLGAAEEDAASRGHLMRRIVTLAISGQPAFTFPDLMRYTREELMNSGKHTELAGLTLQGNGAALTTARVELKLWSGTFNP